MAGFSGADLDLEKLADESEGLSYAEISRACEDSLKDTIINRRKTVTQKTVEQMLSERKKFHCKIFEHSPLSPQSVDKK